MKPTPPDKTAFQRLPDGTARRRRNRLMQSKTVSHSPQNLGDSESSLELTYDEYGLQKKVEDLSLQANDDSLNIGKNNHHSSSLTETSASSSSSQVNEESFQQLLFQTYKTRKATEEESKAPPKYRTSQTFKLDGAPGFIIADDALRARAAERRRKKKTMAELHDSYSSLQTTTATTRKQQRPKVHFLNLPKDHPLYWDNTQLSASDFSEEDRAFLAMVLKHPETTKSALAAGVEHKKTALPRRVDIILKKLHCMDWDVATIGRSAMVLFHPDSNPLQLKPEATTYFFTRFNALKTNLEDGVEVKYLDKTYHRKNGDESSLGDLPARLRQDFTSATANYEVYQSTSPY